MVARSWPAGAPKAGRDSLRKFQSRKTDPAISADSPFRFGADRRLKSKADFERVFQQSVRSTDALFTVLASPSDTGKARLGLAISVRAAGDAVSRNRVKRLVRESFRLNQGAMPPVDLVVMAKSGISSRSNQEIRVSLDTHWQRISRKCATSSPA